MVASKLKRRKFDDLKRLKTRLPKLVYHLISPASLRLTSQKGTTASYLTNPRNLLLHGKIDKPPFTRGSGHCRILHFCTFEAVLNIADRVFTDEKKLVIGLLATEDVVNEYWLTCTFVGSEGKELGYLERPGNLSEPRACVKKIKMIERAEGQSWMDINLAKPEESDEGREKDARKGWLRVCKDVREWGKLHGSEDEN